MLLSASDLFACLRTRPEARAASVCRASSSLSSLSYVSSSPWRSGDAAITTIARSKLGYAIQEAV
eukprot:5203885-Prymnesium_polylepis.1